MPARTHCITPLEGTARRLDGTPADLLNARDYPVEACCTACGQPVRVEQKMLSDWVHVPRFAMTGHDDEEETR